VENLPGMSLMDGLKIRKADKEDQEGILAIFKSRKPRWDKRFAKIYYVDFFEKGAYPNDQVFVGEMGRKIVSVIGCCPDRLETKDVYWLGWFYTHQDFGGKNIGTKLLGFMIKYLSDSARKLYVDTSSDSFYRPALNLYLKIGFQIEAVLRDYYEDGEDQIILGMNL